ncbi:MAG: PAS domain S-box protein, partial [Gammaproteobacteria bacterium]
MVIATFISLEYRQFHIEQDNRLKQESLRLQLASKIIVHDLKHIIVDLLNIADLDWIRAYAKTDSRHSRMQLERFFLNLASNEGLYDQIRFIDKSGYEKIRVNYKNGVAYTSTTEQLQDKSSTYYFREALKLAPGEVFVSPLDLNVEHGKVEQPYRPTLRVATTVFDSSGNLAGVVVLNYMARLVREEFEKIMLNSWGQPMLLNADGFWLYSPVAGDEWGFVLEHNANFSKRFPAAWKNIKSRDAGFLQTDKGLFVFNTLDPVRQVRTDDAEHIGIKQTEQSINHWKLLTYVPLQSAIFGPFDSLHSRPILVAALIVFSAIASLLLALFRTRNIVYTRQLRESELRTRLLLDSVGEGIFGVDSSGTCTFINPRALTLLGYQDASDLIHKPIHQLIHHTNPDGLPCREEECKLYSAFHKQGSFHVESEWMWRKDGTSFPVEYRSTPIVENGRTLGAVAVFNDITSRKMADDALRRSHEELETRVSERTAELEA